MKIHTLKLFGILTLVVFIFNSCFKDDLLKEIDALKTEVSDMKKRNDSLNNVLNVKADSLAKALTNAQKRSDSLSNVLRTKSDSLSLALGLTNVNLANLTKSVDSIKVQVANINGQLTQLNSQLKIVTTQLIQLNQQFGALGADYASLNAKYQELSATLQGLNTQIAALQAEQLKLLERLNAIFLQLNPPVDITTGLVAYFPFSGNAGDSSGNGNHGTVNGATLTSDRFGSLQKAYLFSGSTITPSYIIGNCSSFPTGVRTVSLWFFANDIGTGTAGRALWGYGGQTCGQSWLQNIDNFGNGGNIYEVQGHCTNQQVLYNYGENHPNGNWIHWLITTDPSTGTNFYLNGVKVKKDATFINQTYVTGKKFVFGSYISNDGNNYLWDNNCNPFNGKLDDIRIYNRNLTQSEITYLATH
jgi:predicted  nucleic acid-binding Zn-ribbon protein